jgi:hypothetical protein
MNRLLSRKERPVFDRRIIFDHLAKTGGQALNAWLVDALGERAVTANLVGTHGQLIRDWGGVAAIISGHVFFHGEPLDPRYAYMTLVRHPVERVLSWLDYLLHDVPADASSSALVAAARRFVSSNGRDCAEGEFFDSVSNYYVRHFGSIGKTGLAGDELLAHACRVIESYMYVGLQERIGDFAAVLAAELQLGRTSPIPLVNRTSRRTPLGDLSPMLLAHVRELNALDLEFYRHARRQASARRRASLLRHPLRHLHARWGRPGSRWRKDERPRFWRDGDQEVIVHGCRVEPIDGGPLIGGCWARLTLDFEVARPIPDLLIGMHINDYSGRVMFGTNSAMLRDRRSLAVPGRYSYSFDVQLNLIGDTYMLGFSIFDQSVTPAAEVAWWTEVTRFTLAQNPRIDFIGVAMLPARVGPHDALRGAPEHPALLRRRREGSS